MSTLPVFQTERLFIRPYDDSDFAFLRSLDTDPDVIKYLGHGKIRTTLETERNVSKMKNDYQRFNIGLYIVEHIETNTLIGRAGIIPWTVDGELYFEIGYTFAKNFWGNGFATEAAGHLLAWGRKHLKLPYFVSFINPENSDSIRVAEKIGMSFWKTVVINEHSAATYKIEN